MKTKHNLITNEKNVVFYLHREKGGRFTAEYEGREYPQLPRGTLVEFKNTKRVVDDVVSIIALEGEYLLIEDHGKFSGPKIKCLTDCKVKSNFIANNFRASFPLFMLFLIALIIFIVVRII